MDAPDSDRVRRLEQAKTRTLQRIVELEEAHKNQEIGPKTYEEERRACIDDLARLLLMDPNDRGRSHGRKGTG